MLETRRESCSSAFNYTQKDNVLFSLFSSSALSVLVVFLLMSLIPLMLLWLSGCNLADFLSFSLRIDAQVFVPPGEGLMSLLLHSSTRSWIVLLILLGQFSSPASLALTRSSPAKAGSYKRLRKLGCPVLDGQVVTLPPSGTRQR